MKLNYSELICLALFGVMTNEKRRFLSRSRSNPKRKLSFKTIFAILSIFSITSGLQKATAQISLKFGTNYTLKSGTDRAQGATYLYTLVNDSLDCIVTIPLIQNNAVLYCFDNNTITGNGGYGGNVNRFQPIISVPKNTSTTSYIKFHFQLIKKGTYNSTSKTGTNVVPSHILWMRAFDVDGNGDVNGVKEFVETSNSFLGAWPDETTNLVPQSAIMSGGKNFIISNSNYNGNNISDNQTFAYNAFLYQNTTGAWDVIGGSYVGTNLPAISNGFDDGDRLNSWDFNFPSITPGADFGDAPYSYEGLPANPNPAFHIISVTASNIKVYLGSNKPDADYDPIGSAAANTDDANGIDNGLTTTSFNAYVSGIFSTTITATNTTSSPAYIYGYIDFNGNGIFDANEKSDKVTVPANSAGVQLPIKFSGAFTYNRGSNTKIARFRIGSTDAEVSSPGGMASNGEVEDYSIKFNAILPLNDLNLGANQQNGLVKLTLLAKDEDKVARYAWQQSTDGSNFTEIGTSPYQGNTAGSNTYNFTNIPSGTTSVVYYRVLQYGLDGSTITSNVVVVKMNDKANQLSAMPTLITDYTNIKVQSAIAENLTLHILNGEGKMMMTKLVSVAAGSNTFAVDGWNKFSNGTYYIQVIGSENQSLLKVVVQH